MVGVLVTVAVAVTVEVEQATVAVSVAVFCGEAGVRLLVGSTWAVFTRLVGGQFGTRTSIVMIAVAFGPRMPLMQSTTPAAWVQEKPPPEALTKVTPAGSVSTTRTLL